MISQGQATMSSTPPSVQSQRLGTSEERAKGTKVTKVAQYHITAPTGALARPKVRGAGAVAKPL